MLRQVLPPSVLRTIVPLSPTTRQVLGLGQATALRRLIVLLVWLLAAGRCDKQPPSGGATSTSGSSADSNRSRDSPENIAAPPSFHFPAPQTQNRRTTATIVGVHTYERPPCMVRRSVPVTAMSWSPTATQVLGRGRATPFKSKYMNGACGQHLVVPTRRGEREATSRRCRYRGHDGGHHGHDGGGEDWHGGGACWCDGGHYPCRGHSGGRRQGALGPELVEGLPPCRRRLIL